MIVESRQVLYHSSVVILKGMTDDYFFGNVNKSFLNYFICSHLIFFKENNHNPILFQNRNFIKKELHIW